MHLIWSANLSPEWVFDLLKKDLFGDDAVRADGEGNNDIMINHKENTVPISDPKVKNLVTVPKQAFQFVCTKGGMPPVLTKESELGAGDAFDLRRQ